MQVGELAGIAVGATVMLNILIAGYVSTKLFNNFCTVNMIWELGESKNYHEKKAVRSKHCKDEYLSTVVSNSLKIYEIEQIQESY